MHKHTIELIETFVRSHPREAAKEIETYSVRQSIEILSAIPITHGRQLIEYMLPTHASKILCELPLDETLNLIGKQSADRVSAILRCIERQKRTAILKELPQKTAALCKLRLNYSEDAVGAWMLVDFNILPSDLTTKEALDRITASENLLNSHNIPVVNDKTKLTGVVHVQDLLKAKHGMTLKQLMKKATPSISSRARLVSIIQSPSWDDFDTLPVVGRNQELVGLLRHRDLRRGLKRFNEARLEQETSNALLEVGEAYLGAMASLYSLITGKRKNTHVSENSQ